MPKGVECFACLEGANLRSQTDRSDGTGAGWSLTGGWSLSNLIPGTHSTAPNLYRDELVALQHPGVQTVNGLRAQRRRCMSRRKSGRVGGRLRGRPKRTGSRRKPRAKNGAPPTGLDCKPPPPAQLPPSPQPPGEWSTSALDLLTCEEPNMRSSGRCCRTGLAPSRTVYSLVHEYSSVIIRKTPLHRASPQLDPQLSPKTHLNQQNLKITRAPRTAASALAARRHAPSGIHLCPRGKVG